MRHMTLRAVRRAPLTLLLSATTLVAAGAGCSRSNGATDPALTTAQMEQVSARLGEPFDLKFGQSAEVSGTDLRLTFTRVAGDSRCPSDVVCVWAGDAEIAVRVDRAGTRVGTVELHTNDAGAGRREVDYDGRIVIRLESLAPNTHSSRRIPDAEYVATLLVKSK